MKKFRIYQFLLSTLFVACWSLQLFGETPFTQPVIDMTVALNAPVLEAAQRQEVAKQTAMQEQAAEQGIPLPEIQADKKGEFQAKLTRAFKFRDIALIFQNHQKSAEEKEQFDQLTIQNADLIKYFNLLMIFQLFEKQATMALSATIFEELMSHPINHNTVELFNKRRSLLTFFQGLDTEELDTLVAFIKNGVEITDEDNQKRKIDSAVHIEDLIISKKTDLLQQWVNDQSQDISFMTLAKKHFSNGISLKGLGIATGLSIVLPQLGITNFFGTAMSGLYTLSYIPGVAGMMYRWNRSRKMMRAASAYGSGSLLTAGLSNWQLTKPVVETASSWAGPYFSPIGTFLFGNGICSMTGAVAEKSMKMQRLLEMYQKLDDLKTIAAHVKEKLETYERPELEDIINHLTPITTMDFEDTYDHLSEDDRADAVYTSSFKVTRALYGLALLDTYIALASLTRPIPSDNAEQPEIPAPFAIAQNIIANKDAQAYKTHLGKMYEMMQLEQPQPKQKVKKGKLFRNQPTRAAEQLAITIDRIQHPDQEQGIDLLSITPPKDDMAKQQMSSLVFNIHYLAQALGIVPKPCAKVPLLIINFKDLGLETSKITRDGECIERIDAIRFPILS